MNPRRPSIASSMPGRDGAPPLLGRFILVRLLARSPSGATWLALDTEAGSDPHIALKLFNSQSGELFARHSALADRLERLRGRAITGLPTLRAFGNEQGQYYAAFSWHGGEALKAVLASGADEVSIADWNRLERHLRRGLNTLHRRGFLHLSISPSTVVYHREKKALRLIDWGHMFPASGTAAAGLMFGDVSFDVAPDSSPGAMPGQPVNARDDIDSIACLARERLAGTHPFDGRSALDATRRNAGLDSAARTFNGRRQPLPGAMTGRRRVNPERIGVIAIVPVLAYFIVNVALALWDAPQPFTEPAAPPVFTQATSENEPVTLSNPIESPVAEPDASRPATIASRIDDVAISIDASATSHAEPQAAQPHVRAPNIEPKLTENVASAAEGAIREAPQAAQAVIELPSPVVEKLRTPNWMTPVTIKLLNNAADEVSTSGIPTMDVPTTDVPTAARDRVVACAECDCQSLSDKRSFSTEPMRREEQEFLRRHCG